MSNLINSIVSRNFVEADSIISETVELIMAKKLEEAKKMYAAKMYEQPHSMNRPAAKLRVMDIAEEDIEEMDLSKEKPDYANIEDKRGKGLPFFMSNVNKNSFPNSLGAPKPKSTQTVNTSGKGDIQKEEAEDQLDEARINIVRARIRGGKIQRRKKVSNVPGMTIRGGKLQRMSAAERRRRKLGARKAVRKRMPKMNRALMKRKRSLMKRRALGL